MGVLGSSTGGWAAASVAARAPEFVGCELGCELRAAGADGTAGTTLRAFELDLDWAEAFVSADGFDCAGAFACGSTFSRGCDGELVTGSEATEACAFDAGSEPAWTPPERCCMYHQPPPASANTPPAIPPIRSPLPELLGRLSRVILASWSGGALPNVRDGSSKMRLADTVETC